MYAHENIESGGDAVWMILAPFHSGELNCADTSVKKNGMRGQRMKC